MKSVTLFSVLGVLVVLTSGTPVRAGELLHLSFNEGSGTVAHDSSPQGNDGNLHGSATWSATSYPGLGGSLQMFGRSNLGYVQVPDSNSLKYQGAIYFSAWVDPIRPVYPDGAYAIVTKGASSVTYTFGMYDDLSGTDPNSKDMKMWFSADQPGGTNDGFVGNPVIPYGQWSHIEAYYDGSQLEFFVNGSLDKQFPYSHPLMNNNESLYIGYDAPGFTESYQGLLDEVVLGTPEPATLTLLILGGMALIRRRRK